MRVRVATPLVVVLALSLAACAPKLPESVVPGTKVTVGWSGELTSANAAASPTPGNIDIASVTRDRFGDVVDGAFVPDPGFGTIEIVSDDPFTVRYDLAEPSWSDGIPLDAADLLLGWAGASGWFDTAEGVDEKAGAVESTTEAETPRVDEFARAIEVTFPEPTSEWHSAVTVPVPAHVVGERAFGLDDVMEAKQAVITAIQDEDHAALTKIAAVWQTGFDLPGNVSTAGGVMLSSGPFVVDSIERTKGGQSVTLVPNPSYRGIGSPQVARLELVPEGEQPAADVGGRLDIAQVAPVAENRQQIRDLERKDFTVDTSDDGTFWAMLLNPRGVFTSTQARIAFIHAASANTMAERGGGAWASAFTGTTSMLASPDSVAYQIVNEDSGFAATLGTPGDDTALERENAGVAGDTRVCVLYDSGNAFARGAFEALRESAGEAGWQAVDCSSTDVDHELEARRWDAVITRVPTPLTPADIAAQWGSDGSASITRSADERRDELIAQLAETTDVYEARDTLAQIEGTIVRAAVALPIAVNPRVTIADRRVSAVTARNGSQAPLMWGASSWSVEP